MADTKRSGLTALAGSAIADGDLLDLTDISDTTMAASGTDKQATFADLKTYLDLPAEVYNAAVTTAAGGFATDTYLVGSSIAIPAGRLQAKSMYHCVFNVVKTAAGVASPIVSVRFGTAGSTADTARATITMNAQTAVSDEGVFNVWITFRTVGSGTTTVTQTLVNLTHRLTTTGLANIAGGAFTSTSAGFDSTVAASILGVSVNAGASAAWTVALVQARLFNLV